MSVKNKTLWSTIIQVLISALTALATIFVSSCSMTFE
jgi:hypothetical protein